MVEPGEARVMMFFGKYKGTYTNVGYSWVNPFINTKKLSLRARNLDAQPIKVNDKTGNPVMIGLVLVWKLKDPHADKKSCQQLVLAPNKARNHHDSTQHCQQYIEEKHGETTDGQTFELKFLCLHNHIFKGLHMIA